MSRSDGPAWDLRWTRTHAAALGALCVAAAGLLAASAGAGRLNLGAAPAVFPDRVTAATERIDPNTASIGSLRRLPGIGPMIAERLVEYRSARRAPAFRSPDDLAGVSGIGPRTVEELRPFLEFPASGQADH